MLAHTHKRVNCVSGNYCFVFVPAIEKEREIESERERARDREGKVHQERIM